jgi:hypothetical protein
MREGRVLVLMGRKSPAAARGRVQRA